ncbi:hypothetical protein [Erythrobacter litoralis]|uniref:Uncharacterized protein n=1 Tax=Erythrobacter litoralis (strain HTCC2594) TaxID=314225 RepID=Q2N6P3_ERYLH|nr:hypothetical protein [Erythrobacter litoralis]ABC64648.1 hypothetical protein ELI_12780 [Erythrobacter litoralis HTCC2594]
MSEQNVIEAQVVVGRNLADGEALGLYRFHAMPRVDDHIAIDPENGDPENFRGLQVISVHHFPLSLEAPGGDSPLIETEYVMVLCKETK